MHMHFLSSNKVSLLTICKFQSVFSWKRRVGEAKTKGLGHKVIDGKRQANRREEPRWRQTEKDKDG